MDTMQQDSREKLVTDLKLVIKDAEELLRNTTQQVDAGYQSARARFESTLQDAKIGLSSMDGRMRSGANDALQTTHRYVQDNPWQAVGAGAVAGLLIGLLIGRK
jgi:ElaB/YqjD/DUF883 family membrane-anchored ribosome-binding protein